MTKAMVAPKQKTEKESAFTIALQCPCCGYGIGEVSGSGESNPDRLVCGGCLRQVRQEDGVWNALSPEREEYFRTFVSNYEAVRAAEGRGSRNAEFYLALPDRDLSGRNQSQWNVRRCTFKCIETKVLPALERTRNSRLDVLDLGAGNCWLSYRLALRGHRPVAVDLLANSMDGLGAASHYRTRVPQLFPRFRAELDRLPFEDSQFDVAIFNASFHYSENYAHTLKEALRCLRRDGSVVVADTAWYSSEASGLKMLEERKSRFQSVYGFASDTVSSLEFLTDERVADLQKELGIRWRTYQPSYEWRWRIRPLVAKFRRRREPARFRVYVAEVAR